MSKKNKDKSQKEEVTPEIALITELEERVAKLEKEQEEANDKYLRLTAEYDNYRKRTLKEKIDLTKTAGEKIFMNMLTVIDNLERAKASLQEAQDINAVKDGLDIIYKDFTRFLTQNGVQEMDVVNKEFDMETSEAITKIPAPSEGLQGKVVDCTEKGYFLHDKILRYAKVVIGE